MIFKSLEDKLFTMSGPKGIAHRDVPTWHNYQSLVFGYEVLFSLLHSSPLCDGDGDCQYFYPYFEIYVAC